MPHSPPQSGADDAAWWRYSGIDLRRWAATHPHLPVILMTGYAALAGVQDTGEVLRKPLPPRDLGAALAAAVAS